MVLVCTMCTLFDFETRTRGKINKTRTWIIFGWFPMKEQNHRAPAFSIRHMRIFSTKTKSNRFSLSLSHSQYDKRIWTGQIEKKWAKRKKAKFNTTRQKLIAHRICWSVFESIRSKCVYVVCCFFFHRINRMCDDMWQNENFELRLYIRKPKGCTWKTRRATHNAFKVTYHVICRESHKFAQYNDKRGQSRKIGKAIDDFVVFFF